MTLTLMMAITSPIAGHWVDKKGSKIPGICCMLSFMVGSVLLFLSDVEPNFVLLMVALVLFGFSTATSLISTLAGSINNIPDEKTRACYWNVLHRCLAWMRHWDCICRHHDGLCK